MDCMIKYFFDFLNMNPLFCLNIFIILMSPTGTIAADKNKFNLFRSMCCSASTVYSLINAPFYVRKLKNSLEW